VPARADLVIRGALVYDGTGAPPRPADVALRGDRIAALGAGLEGTRVLDAAGLALAPGFIDVHTHDDFAVLLHPEMGFKVLGGVTTCVVGNCGFGTAPWSPARLLAQAFHPNAKIPEWTGTAGYLERLEAEPPSVNVAALVGHGTLRLGAMGSARRAPSAAELAEMQAGLSEGLDAGAFGLSTGLIYEPGRFAATDEIVELAQGLRGTGALYATHLRDEGRGLLAAVREALEIGERAGVPVQISHHKASGRDAWGLVRESLRLLEEARERGLDVYADQYPYTAGSTVLAAIAQNEGLRGGAGGVGGVGPEDVVIASSAGHPAWEGRSIAEFAAEWGLGAQQAAERLLAEEPGTTVVIHSMSEEDVRTVLRHPTTMIGSDGLPTLAGKPHPRLFGTFARVLGRYARELGLFPLEEAVHRMTGLPAARFGLHGRGAVRPGAWADLVLFDPARVRDVGTYEDPKRPPEGILHVFVNGTAVVRDGEHTGARPGRTLRRAAA
jgi:N-acyl-D-aspartate/D-glutamate deacylase